MTIKNNNLDYNLFSGFRPLILPQIYSPNYLELGH